MFLQGNEVKSKLQEVVELLLVKKIINYRKEWSVNVTLPYNFATTTRRMQDDVYYPLTIALFGLNSVVMLLICFGSYI